MPMIRETMSLTLNNLMRWDSRLAHGMLAAFHPARNRRFCILTRICLRVIHPYLILLCRPDLDAFGACRFATRRPRNFH